MSVGQSIFHLVAYKIRGITDAVDKISSIGGILNIRLCLSVISKWCIKCLCGISLPLEGDLRLSGVVWSTSYYISSFMGSGTYREWNIDNLH